LNQRTSTEVLVGYTRLQKRSGKIWPVSWPYEWHVGWRFVLQMTKYSLRQAKISWVVCPRQGFALASQRLGLYKGYCTTSLSPLPGAPGAIQTPEERLSIEKVFPAASSANFQSNSRLHTALTHFKHAVTKEL
jgi:hypothetical protein